MPNKQKHRASLTMTLVKLTLLDWPIVEFQPLSGSVSRDAVALPMATSSTLCNWHNAASERKPLFPLVFVGGMRENSGVR